MLKMKPLEIDKVTSARKLFNDAPLLFYEKRSSILIHHLAHACAEPGNNINYTIDFNK